MSHTNRLYYDDSYLISFPAQVVEASADGKRVYLNHTAFYPASGGQPSDLGRLGAVAVLDVIDEGGRVAHLLEAPLPGPDVLGLIDWPRRFDHMQQHTGQHLLSAVFVQLAKAETVGFHLGAESSTVELAGPPLPASKILEVERRANELVFANRPVSVHYQHSSDAEGLRKPSEREGVLRIVEIAGLDRSACGGTHVSRTGEIGPILLRKMEKIRGNVRVEFLCGGRAVRRARADFEALSRIARSFSAPLDETPALVAAQIEKSAESDKARRKLGAELAALRGRELYAASQPGPDGVRKAVRRVEAMTEELRAEAQSFTAGAKAVLLLLAEHPSAALLAASKDSGWHAGEWLKAALAQVGGRGGGSPAMAQGSLAGKEGLEAIAAKFGL